MPKLPEIEWQGKKALLHLENEILEFPIKSLNHYYAVKNFINDGKLRMTRTF